MRRIEIFEYKGQEKIRNKITINSKRAKQFASQLVLILITE